MDVGEPLRVGDVGLPFESQDWRCCYVLMVFHLETRPNGSQCLGGFTSKPGLVNKSFMDS